VLRTVKGGSAADLDTRALTTDDDLIDLDELYPSGDDDSRSDRETAETERSPVLEGRTETQQRENVTPTPHTAAGGAEKREAVNGAGGDSATRTALVTTTVTEAKSASPQPASNRPTAAPRLLPTGPTRKTARRGGERPSLTRAFGRVLPAPGRALGAAMLALVVAGVAATVIAELLLSSPPGHPQPKRASSVGTAPGPGPSPSQIELSDAQSLVAQKRAMSLTVERVASEQQAAEQRQARARAAARRRARIKAQHASAASTASSTTSSAAPLVSSAADSTVSQSSGASSAASLPSTTSPAPSSSSSSSHSTNQSPAGSKQPAFGSSGSLGPGSSPDG
jgi:hypothetical protein